MDPTPLTITIVCGIMAGLGLSALKDEARYSANIITNAMAQRIETAEAMGYDWAPLARQQFEAGKEQIALQLDKTENIQE